MAETTPSPTTPPAAPPSAAPVETPPAAKAAETPAPAAAPADVLASALVEEKAPEKKADEKPAPLELKLPDGFAADEKALGDFKTLASELGLDSAKAQKVFDQYVAIEAARTAATEKAYAEQSAKWAAEVEADPDLGGAKLKATQKEVRAAIGFVGKPFAELMSKTGFGSNPTVIRALARIGRSLANDTISGTEKAPPSGERLSDAALLYGPHTSPSKTKEQ